MTIAARLQRILRREAKQATAMLDFCADHPDTAPLRDEPVVQPFTEVLEGTLVECIFCGEPDIHLLWWSDMDRWHAVAEWDCRQCGRPNMELDEYPLPDGA